MLSSLKVKNFRGLRDIDLSKLSRINIVVGPNASGKTALLEAILLGCRANPQTALSIWQTRSQILAIPVGMAGFRTVWSGFFPGLDMNNTITIDYGDSEIGACSLVISPGAPPSIILGQAENTIQPLSNSGQEVKNLIFKRKKNDHDLKDILCSIDPNGQLAANGALGDDLGPPAAIFSAFTSGYEPNNVVWFSELSLTNRENEVLNFLKDEFPFIKTIDILNLNGVEGIYVGHKEVSGKLPISVISSGVNKILSLILSSLIIKQGLILIDEIENGVFYRRYENVWKLLHKLSAKQENQIFVSSHSLECLRAALPIASEHPEDFTLIRMGRDGNGITAKIFNGVEFTATIEQNVDPRGREFV